MRTLPSFLRFPLALATLLVAAGCGPGGEFEVSTDGALADTEAEVACGVALKSTAVSASGSQEGNPPEQAVDGNLSTRWSQKGVGSYITLDLGAQKSVCGLGVAWYSGNTRQNSFTVSVSADGSSFKQVLSATSSGATTAVENVGFAAATARYIRLTVNGNTLNTWASVVELVSYGSNSTFAHPGIFVSRSQLDLVKAKIAAGAQPWKSAFDRAKGSRYGSLSYTPSPVAYVGCGSYNSIDEGCTAEMDDALAAYTHALLWAYTGETAYAQKAIQILNAWSAVLIDHRFDTKTYTNGLLQAAWAGSVFTRAAELVRHTNGGWGSADVDRFSKMLRNAFLPRVINLWTYTNGNWLLSMTEATLNIAVFLDDRALFDKAVADWRAEVPGYIYLKTDGSVPVKPLGWTPSDMMAYWYNPGTLVDGLIQETCRDLSHAMMGLAAMSNTAETARIQGVDLFGAERRRITAGYEFIAKYLNGAAVPSTLCGGTLNFGGTIYKLSGEVAYNHYAGTLGVSLPETQKFLPTVRPMPAALHMAWETLTHGR